MNEKLLNLGYDVIRLRQKIDKEFPPILAESPAEQNPVAVFFHELLELVNQIRMNVDNGDKKITRSTWNIEVDCFDEELCNLTRYLNSENFNYEIKKLDSEHEG